MKTKYKEILIILRVVGSNNTKPGVVRKLDLKKLEHGKCNFLHINRNICKNMFPILMDEERLKKPFQAWTNNNNSVPAKLAMLAWCLSGGHL